MRVLMVALMFLSGCGEYGDCKLGKITGVWRVQYRQTNGTCGKISDVISVINLKSSSTCTDRYRRTSTDLCRMEFDTVCSEGGVSWQWTGITNHVDDGRLEGTYSLQMSDCRSTYSVTFTRM